MFEIGKPYADAERYAELLVENPNAFIGAHVQVLRPRSLLTRADNETTITTIIGVRIEGFRKLDADDPDKIVGWERGLILATGGIARLSRGVGDHSSPLLITHIEFSEDMEMVER